MPEVSPFPNDYPRVVPYLIVAAAPAAIAFYQAVLGATERMRMVGPDGRVGHAELAIGESIVMLADEHPEAGIRGPRAFGGTPVTIAVYVEDVDAAIARAVERGATLQRPAENRFYGDRVGQVEDPWGHIWSIQTHVEDVAPEELARRAAAEH